MTIEDAVRRIAGDWSDIEPRLSVRALETLAEPDVGSGPGRQERLAEYVLRVVGEALPPDHPVWRALVSSRSRLAGPVHADLLVFSPAALPQGAAVDVVELARAALRSPSIELDRRADEVTTAALAALLEQMDVVRQLPGRDTGLLALQVGRERVYPTFQFIEQDPGRPREVVARVRAEVGWATDPIGEVSWWLSPNAWLGDSPVRLLDTEREPEIGYAAAQLRNDSW